MAGHAGRHEQQVAPSLRACRRRARRAPARARTWRRGWPRSASARPAPIHSSERYIQPASAARGGQRDDLHAAQRPARAGGREQHECRHDRDAGRVPGGAVLAVAEARAPAPAAARSRRAAGGRGACTSVPRGKRVGRHLPLTIRGGSDEFPRRARSSPTPVVHVDAVVLLDRVAAVDHDRLAGDVARCVRGQERDQVGDLLRPAGAAERRGAAGDDLVAAATSPSRSSPAATELTVTP